MGSYTDRLAARLRDGGNGRKSARPTRQHADAMKTARAVADTPDSERIVAVAIIRDSEVHSRGFKSHAQLRAALGDAQPYQDIARPNDTEGFLTSTGRFVNRREVVQVAQQSGQCRGRIGELLSSDIDSW